MSYNMQAIADVCRIEKISLTTAEVDVKTAFTVTLPTLPPLQIVLTALDPNIQYKHKYSDEWIDLPAYDAAGGGAKVIPSHDALDNLMVQTSTGTGDIVVEAYFAK